MRIGVMLRTIDERQGIGVYTQNLMDNLLSLDDKNEYILFYRTPQFQGRYVHHSNVREILIEAPSKAVWDQVKVPLEVRRQALDVLFHTKFTVPLRSATKSVMVLHGSEWFVYPKAYKFIDRSNIRIMMPLYCKKATFMLSNSEMTKRDFASILGVAQEKIRTIYFGIDPRFRPIQDDVYLREIRKRYRLPDKFFLFVGRLYPGKNFGNLLRAFSKIQKSYPHKIVVAGHPRYAYEDDVNLVSELGLQDKIHFTGWVPQEDLVAFYSLADAFVFPSFYEGFGIVLLEAMAAGCPVLASKTGAIPEISDGAAMLIDPHDPDDIADAMRRMLDDESARHEMVTRGLKRAKLFTWEKCAKETLEVLETVGGA